MSADMSTKGYVGPPSIGHELGIIFGFLALMAICMGAYVLVWQYGNKVGARREAERIEALRASGRLDEKRRQPEAERKDDKVGEIPL